MEDKYKCSSCDGTGQWNVSLRGEEHRTTCGDCHGEGKEFMYITTEEYDTLLNYKFMYEGLNK